MKWRIVWSENGKKMATERATREEAVPVRNECQKKYSDVKLRIIENSNRVKTEIFEDCQHPGNMIQQFTDLCLACGDNEWDDHPDPGPTVPYDQFVVASRKVTFSFEGKNYSFLQYEDAGEWRAEGWSRKQKWLNVVSKSDKKIEAEFFKAFYLEDKEI